MDYRRLLPSQVEVFHIWGDKMIRFLTAGESHGDGLTGIIDGIPANLYLDRDYINEELRRRQGGFGRSERMKIEKD